MLKQHVQKFSDLHRSHSWVWGLLQWQKFACIRKNGQSENWKEKSKKWIIEDIFLYFFQVFLIDEVGSDIFLKQVQEFETNNCL